MSHLPFKCWFGRDLKLNVSSAIKGEMKQSYTRAKINYVEKKLRLLIKTRRIYSVFSKQ